eukprot:3367917-Rhodomonas_salina.1
MRYLQLLLLQAHQSAGAGGRFRWEVDAKWDDIRAAMEQAAWYCLLYVSYLPPKSLLCVSYVSPMVVSPMCILCVSYVSYLSTRRVGF